MELYDTLSGRVKPVEPGPDGVTVYVCGITPYDTTHLGHAFLYVVFDVLIRHIESRGQRVAYAQNVTDIDDDILRKAGELGMDYLELGRRETERFRRDLGALGARSPDYYPRATEEVDGMVQVVAKLVQGGNAYVRDGNVYFRHGSYAAYGELSRLDRAEMLALARERGGNPDDPLRDDPLDFLLWQATREGEPSWSSPWGPGRPGWHIECSQMALRYLGHPVTIHGGGSDLIFPHHECERAQSESLDNGAPFVTTWMHVGMLRYEGEKMSKSLGNLVLVGDLLERHSPDAVRIALLSHHYRESWEYGDADLDDAQRRADRLAAAAGQVPVEDHPASPEITTHLDEARAALDRDLDTPEALRALERAADLLLAGGEGEGELDAARAAFRECGAVLGLTFESARAPSVG